MNLITTIISFLYAITGIVVFFGYLPTIRDLSKKKKSANIHSYLIWTVCAGISFLYALIVISDFLLELMTGLNFLACATILVMAIKLK